MRSDAARKPLLGFGWAGWLLAAIALSLLGSLIAGIDLRYRLQELIMHTLGVDAMMRFTIELGFHGICFGTWPPHEHVGPVTLCVVLLGLHLHPRRVGAIRMAPLIALATLGPTAWSRLLRLISRELHLSGIDEAMVLAALVWWVVSFAILWWAVRSGRVAVLIGVVLLIPLGTHALPWLGSTEILPEALVAKAEEVQRHAGLAMNLGLAAILIPWGLRERLRVVAPYACQICGYDIRGLPPPCPECGSSPSGSADRAVDLPRGRADVEAGSPVVPSGAQRDQEHDRIR